MKKFCELFIPLFFVLLVLCGLPEQAFAQASQAIANCPSYAQNNMLFTPIMKCVSDVMSAVSQTYINDIISRLSTAVVGAMTIAIGLLAARIALGGTQHSAAESYLLIVKISLVNFFVLQSGVVEYLGYLTDITGAITDVFINVLDPSQDRYTVTGDRLVSTDSSTAQQVTVPPGGKDMWLEIDFLVQRILGLSGSDTNLGQGIVGIFMLVSGLFFLGPIGGWIAVITSFTIALLFAAFAMVVFTYIASFIAIMVLGAFSPIVIPMVLFTSTRNIFEKWLEQVINYSLQPVILTAFVMFMLAVMQNASTDFIAQYKEISENATSKNNNSSIPLFSMDVQVKTSKPGVEDRESYEQFVHRFVEGMGFVTEPNPTTTKGMVGGTIEVPFLVCDKKCIKEFALNFILNAFLLFVMMGFVQQLPIMVSELVGDRSVPNLAQKFGDPIYSTAMRAQDSITAGMRR